MKELSLTLLDIAKNSVKAEASLIDISLVLGEDGWLTMTIKDDGCGMSEAVLAHVTDPFYTTRTTRKVGLGLPFLKLAAEQTGGALTLSSSNEAGKSGTVLCATFDTKSIDCMPMGDIVSTVCALVSGSPETDFCFADVSPAGRVELDTRELRAVLGDGISLAEPEVVMWMKEYLEEQYQNRE